MKVQRCLSGGLTGAQLVRDYSFETRRIDWIFTGWHFCSAPPGRFACENFYSRLESVAA
jgi:hypothetical protein